ncbi:MAG TPA: hypothetical protein VFE52_02625 [Devosia sp.]|jgi:hypothetical protein|nr:hypothetical protein [Devosia sp.]
MESSSDLAGVEDDENVDFILLSELDLQGRETELEDALERNQANIDLLRTDLASHPNLVTQITGAGHAVEDVVAIVVERQGSSEVIIFLDDRA